MDSPLRKVATPLSLWSLRNRLVVGVVVLSALGFVASDFVAKSALESFLVGQVDDQLASVAGGTALRLDRAGIAPEENAAIPEGSTENEDLENVRKRRTATAPTLRPLRQVPTAISVTLLDPDGRILGGIGGDLNTQEIGKFVKGMTAQQVQSHKNLPFSISVPGADFRVLTRVLPSELGSVVVAQSLDNVDKTTHQLQLLFIFIGLIALILIGVASRKVIDLGLRPLAEVELTAESIAAGNLSARLPDAKPDTEVGRLVSSLNQMLTRIEGAFSAQAESENRLRRFVADASHELRTPITAIRGFAELNRQGAVQGKEATDELIVRIEKESLRMGTLVEDLLLLARLDQSREMEKKPVNMREVIDEVVASAHVAGPNHPIDVAITEGDIYILGDSHRVHQVIANLLANARAHTPAGTAISVKVVQDDNGTSVSVTDKGPGLSSEDQKRIFERFFRADLSRSRNADEGSGLGLSIVDAVMRAHGGRVSVISKLGEGATFTLFFPIVL